jgi:hypothetical protein
MKQVGLNIPESKIIITGSASLGIQTLLLSVSRFQGTTVLFIKVVMGPKQGLNREGLLVRRVSKNLGHL